MRAVLGKIISGVSLRDCFVFGGLSITASGIAMIHAPAAVIFFGAVIMWLGVRK